MGKALSFFLFLGVSLAYATNDLQSSYNLINLPAQIKSGSKQFFCA